MKIGDKLPGIALVIGVSLITLFFWATLLKTGSNKSVIATEPFINQEIINQVIQSSSEVEEEKPISSTQAATYYRALLVYLKSDFTNGLKLVHDLNKRIYSKKFPIPDTFDPRTVMDNYLNPIAGI